MALYHLHSKPRPFVPMEGRHRRQRMVFKKIFPRVRKKKFWSGSAGQQVSEQKHIPASPHPFMRFKEILEANELMRLRTYEVKGLRSEAQSRTKGSDENEKICELLFLYAIQSVAARQTRTPQDRRL